MNQPLALVIDDEPDICELLTLTLARMDIQTETAEDEGREDVQVEADRNDVRSDERQVGGALQREGGLGRLVGQHGFRVANVEADDAADRVRQDTNTGHGEHGELPDHAREDRDDDEESASEDRSERRAGGLNQRLDV